MYRPLVHRLGPPSSLQPPVTPCSPLVSLLTPCSPFVPLSSGGSCLSGLRSRHQSWPRSTRPAPPSGPSSSDPPPAPDPPFDTLFLRSTPNCRWELSEWPQIAELAKEHEPSASLWSIASELSVRSEDWLFGSVQGLDPEEMDTLVTEWYKKMQRLAKSMPLAEHRRMVSISCLSSRMRCIMRIRSLFGAW